MVSSVFVRNVITALIPKHHTRNRNTSILFDYLVKLGAVPRHKEYNQMFLCTLYSSRADREDGHCQKNPEINTSTTCIYFLSSHRPCVTH